MSPFPGSPKVLKGSFIRYDRSAPEGKAIVFQYNPNTIVRHIQPSLDKSVSGSARESIDMTLELDATDPLEEAGADDLIVQHGLHPVLSALKLLLEEETEQNQSFFDRLFGRSRRSDQLTLFIWGNARILPVRLTSIKITEEAFDTHLNPIRARVEISMRVLTDADLGRRDRGYQFFIKYRQTTQDLAETEYVNSG